MELLESSKKIIPAKGRSANFRKCWAIYGKSSIKEIKSYLVFYPLANLRLPTSTS